MRKGLHHAPRRKQKGAVAVAFILFVALLLAFMGFATDVGRLYVSKSELQNAADACALAAAAELTGLPISAGDQLLFAENAGITTGTRNLMGMQDSPVAITANNQVKFSATLNGTYRTRANIASSEVQNMRYALCTLSESVSTLILQVANMIPGQSIPSATTILASAVASREPSKSNCALPIAICQAGAAPDFGLVRGQWLQGILKPSENIEGAFKWIEYPGYERNKDLAALIEGQGQCDVTGTNSVQSHPGYIDSMLAAWNTRLGIYKPGGPTVAQAQPDATGWIYDPIQWLPQADAYGNYAGRRGQASPKHQTGIPQNDPEVPGSYPLPNPNSWADDADFLPANDRRLVLGPIVDCPSLGSNGTVQVLDWACYLILNPVFNPGDTMWFEYRGLASDLASGCVTSGAPGGPNAAGPKVPTLVQ
jgi:hypothetical protein